MVFLETTYEFRKIVVEESTKLQLEVKKMLFCEIMDIVEKLNVFIDC